MTNPYPPDVQAELARERNRIAADRTLLSFVRNSLTLITAGVGIDQVLRALAPEGPFIDSWVFGLSLGLVSLGIASLMLAIRDYRGELARLQQGEYYFTPRRSVAQTAGLALLGTGVVAFGWLAFRLVH